MYSRVAQENDYIINPVLIDTDPKKLKKVSHGLVCQKIDWNLKGSVKETKIPGIPTTL